jgi:hypothetical protein
MYTGPNIITNGLVLSLDAANIKSYPGSGTVWGDLSGNRNNGTLINSPGYSNSNNGTLIYNGTNQYINMGSLPAFNFGTGEFSVFFWIYPTAWADGGSRGIIDKKTNDASSGWTIYNDGSGANSSKINIRLSLTNNFTSSTNVAVNAWQQWTFVRNVSSNTYWYFNGALDASSTNSSNLTDAASLQIARSQTWNGWFKGNLPAVQIYNRALSASEISQNYNATKGRFGL